MGDGRGETEGHDGSAGALDERGDPCGGGANPVSVRAMRTTDAVAVSRVADRAAGVGYYSDSEVLATLARSRAGTRRPLAYVAETEAGVIVGFRFALAPGTWSRGRGPGLSPERWPAAQELAGYFLSCFIMPGWTGRGIGRLLAGRALGDLRANGARAVVAHCWKESPHGSSRRYLERLGFRAVGEHPDYWVDVDYVCAVDGRPCRCTAIEMVRPL